MIRFDTKKDMEHYDNLYKQIIEQKQEIERLSKEVDMWNKKYNEQIDIINELERFLKYEIYCDFNKEMTKSYQDTLDKLKELKEGNNE